MALHFLRLVFKYEMAFYNDSDVRSIPVRPFISLGCSCHAHFPRCIFDFDILRITGVY